MSSTHSLTAWLMKDHPTTFDIGLKDPLIVSKNDIAIAGATQAAFVYKEMPSKAPKWAVLFKNHVQEASNFRNSGSAAVLFVKLNTGKAFALTFGFGWQLLNLDSFENNFGLRVVLNAVDPEKLRSLDVHSLEGIPLQQRTQAGKASGIAEFGLDIEQDMLCSATGIPKDSALGSTISGKDSLHFSIPIDLDSLTSTLLNLETLFTATTYRTDFPWIDHLSEVRDKSVTQLLDSELLRKLTISDFSKTWLAVPEPIDWQDVDCFRYIRPKRGQDHTDINWPEYLKSRTNSNPINISDLKGEDVHCISQSTGYSKHRWSIYKCTYAEILYQGNTYALTNGKWYQVEANYLATIDASMLAIDVSTGLLPASTTKDEATYNEGTARANSAQFALMDKKVISHGGGHSKIEFCDLFTHDKKMIHVKRYGGSSVLSHLFAQAVISARLFLSDPDFRGKVNQRLPQTHRIKDHVSPPDSRQYEVVYAVMSNAGVNPIDLPLFSKINLRNAAQTFQAFGLKLSFTSIAVP